MNHSRGVWRAQFIAYFAPSFHRPEYAGVSLDKRKQQLREIVRILEKLRIQVAETSQRDLIKRSDQVNPSLLIYRQRLGRYDAQRLQHNRGALVSADSCQSCWCKISGLAAAVTEVLMESAIIHLAFQCPNGREHFLLFALLHKLDAQQISPLALG